MECTASLGVVMKLFLPRVVPTQWNQMNVVLLELHFGRTGAAQFGRYLDSCAMGTSGSCGRRADSLPNQE